MVWRILPRPSAAQRQEEVHDKAIAASSAARSFWRDRRGSAVIEFAMIAPIFFTLLFSMFEVGITYSADAMLQNAVTEAARQIRTGEVALSGQAANPDAFRDRVCSSLSALLTCGPDLKIEVRPFTSISDANCTNPRKADGSFRSSFTFNPGTAGSFILVCAFYQWDTFTPGLGTAMSATPGGFMLQASAAVRNEPFGPTSP